MQRREFLKGTLGAVAAGALYGVGAFELDSQKERENEKSKAHRETLEKMRGELANFNFEQVDRCLEDLVGPGFDKILVAKPTIKSLSLKIGTDKHNKGVTEISDDGVRISITAEHYIDESGNPNLDGLKMCVIHEYLHLFSYQKYEDENGKQHFSCNWRAEQGISNRFYEGTTEYLTMVIAKKLGLRIGIHGYDRGGEPFLGFFMARLVGREKLAKSYCLGDSSELKGAVDNKYGVGTAKKLLESDNDNDYKREKMVGYLRLHKARRALMFEEIKKLLGDKEFENFMAAAVNEGLVITS